jgi:hypothetical protein
MKHKSVRESNESQTNVLAYETTEDSIGTKTFSGLHFMTTMNMYKMINFIEKMTNMYKMIIFIEKMTMHQKGCISICISIQTNTIHTEIYQDSDSGVETDLDNGITYDLVESDDIAWSS